MLDRMEFLTRRRSGIGGSDVAAILGISKWKSAYEVWKDKTDDSPVVDIQSDVLSLASYLEEYTAQKYSVATAYKVRRRNTLLVADDHPFLIGNIDREILGDPRGVGILECKAVSRFFFSRIELYGLPDDYTLQMQHYFHCGNQKYRWGAFAILCRESGRLLYFEVAPDAALYAEVEPKLVEFWGQVETNTPPVESVLPPLPDAPKYEGKLEDFNADAALAGMLKEYDEVTAMLKDAGDLADSVKQRIADHLQSHEAVECAGRRVFYKSSRRSSFDSKRFKLDHPDDYYKYVKEIETQKSLRIYNINQNTEAK